MPLTRRDLLKRTGLLAGALGIAVALPEVAETLTQPEIETPTQPQVEEPSRVLGYWYCRRCGRMNTQSNQTCKICRTPLDDETQKIEFAAEKPTANDIVDQLQRIEAKIRSDAGI